MLCYEKMISLTERLFERIIRDATINLVDIDENLKQTAKDSALQV